MAYFSAKRMAIISNMLIWSWDWSFVRLKWQNLQRAINQKRKKNVFFEKLIILYQPFKFQRVS